jgi:hypothetical protein
VRLFARLERSRDAARPPAMITFHRSAREARAVLDPLHAPLPLGAEIEMILKQRPQQLTTVRRKPGLEI